LRPPISYTADKVRRQIARIDNPEVRKARTLVRLARTGPLDILVLGDSAASFVAPYDTDKRPLRRMFADAFGPEVATHAVHGGSYNPLIFNEYVRMLEGQPTRPVVVLPLTVRVRTLPWIEHPLYGHKRASQFLSTVDATTPPRRIRKGFVPPSAEEFAQFYALPFATWAGDLTIGDYVQPLKRKDVTGDDAARLLYAYHHGGEIVPGAPLDKLREMGERLRRLGLPVVAYQTPVPVQRGVELHGPQFHELAEHNFAVIEQAFVSGYGDLPIARTGLTAPTAHFIDWRDGSEHVNEHGRSALTAAVLDAAKDLDAFPRFGDKTRM
jgi:hypothetical protein